jgi:DNA polymerase-3 subunit delta'
MQRIPPNTDDDAAAEALHPRETTLLVGHAEAERSLLEAYRGGRIPHAWLIGGPRGIGKATLAYRLARFVLAHREPAAAEVQSAQSLALAPDHPVVRRVAAEAQGDLLVLQRTINEQTGKLYTVIRVEEVRRTVSFFGSTAGEGGWRVAIIDSVDELNAEGANSLLKVLEEPPPRTLLLLVSHAAGRVLPTIRSRCRVLMLRSLSPEEVGRGAAAALGREPGDAELQEAAAVADGSVARALSLLDGSALALRRRVTELLDSLPALDQRGLHALGDMLSGSEPQTLATFVQTVNAHLTAKLKDGPQDLASMGRIAAAWENINGAASEVAEYNLDRKPLVFSVFGLLAEAARG